MLCSKLTLALPFRLLCGWCIVLGLLLQSETGAPPLLAQVDSNPDVEPPTAQVAAPQYKTPFVLEFHGEIHPLMDAYVQRKLETAQAAGADLIILDIDSPGGYVATAFKIMDRVNELPDNIHTIAYIRREALSAAAFVALACDEIVMHPTARLGDAGGINQGSPDVALRVRTIAAENGRPGVLAEAMVDRKVVVMQVTDGNGNVEYISKKQYEKSPDKWTDAKKLEASREDRFLEVIGKTAVELQLADETAQERTQLEERLALEQPPQVLRFTNIDLAVLILNSPLVTGLLLLIGIIALAIEFSAPGIGAGGLTALLCAGLFFWSRFLGGTSGWLEVTLFVLGIIFLAMELFVIPGFGFAGIVGIGLLGCSVIMASQEFVVPENGQQWETLLISMLVLMGATGCSVLLLIIFSARLNSIPFLDRFVLKTTAKDKTDEATRAKTLAAQAAQQTRVDVGDWGVADSPLRPAGKANFADQFIDVVTDGAFVEKGAQVRIIEIHGNRVVVREIT